MSCILQLLNQKLTCRYLITFNNIVNVAGGEKRHDLINSVALYIVVEPNAPKEME